MLSIDTDAASRLLQKLREFVRTRLEEDERALAAVLLAPGLAQAYAEEEVAGVPSTRWSERALPEASWPRCGQVVTRCSTSSKGRPWT